MKGLIKITILAVIVAGLGFYIFWMDSPDRVARKQEIISTAPVFEGLNTDDVKKVVIDKKGDQDDVTLEKSDDIWYVLYSEDEKYLIVKKYLQTAFDTVSQTHRGEIISSNKDNFSKFDLTEEKQVIVKFYTDSGQEPVYELVMGKMGPVYPSQYIKTSNNNQVLLVKKSFATLFDRQKEGWRDKSVLSLPKDKLVDLTFYFKNPAYRKYTLGREDNVWKIKYPIEYEADEGLADRLFSELANLQAVGFLSRRESSDLKALKLEDGKERLKIVINMNDVAPQTLLVGDKIKQDGVEYYYAKTSDSDVVYRLSSSIDIFTKQNLQKLKKKN